MFPLCLLCHWWLWCFCILTACRCHFISILYAILLATLPFLNKPLFANVLMSEFELFIYCWCAVLLNEYTSLTIHHIMHIWPSQFHVQTCDVRICFIVVACHGTLALSINNRHKHCYLLWKCRSWSKSPLRQEHMFIAFFPAFVNLQRNVSNLFFPQICIIAGEVAVISFLFVPSAHFDTLWETFTSAFVL